MHMPTRQKMNADDYVAASRAPSTRREYAKDQRYFLKAGGKLPATADDVVNWLVSVAPVLAPATIQRRLVAIHCWHKEQRLESPVIDPKVKRVQAGINRIRGTAQRAVTPLVRDDLLGVLQALEREATTRAARDMAILLLLFSGALRRSSLVEIRIEHLTVHELGMDIHLPRSKTDQTGKGVAVSIPFAFGEHCPVKAVAYWMLLSAVEVGYLFRSVDRAGRIGSTKLNVASIARVPDTSRLRPWQAAPHTKLPRSPSTRACPPFRSTFAWSISGASHPCCRIFFPRRCSRNARTVASTRASRGQCPLARSAKCLGRLKLLKDGEQTI
jgi:integrase